MRPAYCASVTTLAATVLAALAGTAAQAASLREGVLARLAQATTTPTAPPTAAGCLVPAGNGYGGYESPYALVASVCDPALTPDYRTGFKLASNFGSWTVTPSSEWANLDAMLALQSAWGPWYLPFPAPDNVLSMTLFEQTARVLAATTYHLGNVPYRHAHSAEWLVMPAPGWLEAGFPPGAGFDCSDYSHFNYNMALGVQLYPGISEQAQQTTAEVHVASTDGASSNVVTVSSTVLFDVRAGWNKNYDELVHGLQPGDLLYIRSDPKLTLNISHVIMWLTPLATDSLGKDGYLVTDSFGDVAFDSNGNQVPSGPQIRPFLNTTYYFNCFDHVVRWLPLNVVT